MALHNAWCYAHFVEQNKPTDVQDLAIQDWKSNNPGEAVQSTGPADKHEVPTSIETPSTGRIVVELIAAAIWGYAISLPLQWIGFIVLATDQGQPSPGQKQLSDALLFFALITFFVAARSAYKKSMRRQGY